MWSLVDLKVWKWSESLKKKKLNTHLVKYANNLEPFQNNDLESDF